MTGLYNMLFGHDAASPFVLAALDAEHNLIPRFRDAYLTMERNEPVMVIHTRTGGNNREDHIEGIEYLRGLRGYLRDADCTHDATYANFIYSVPMAFRESVAEWLKKYGLPLTPEQKFAYLMMARRK